MSTPSVRPSERPSAPEAGERERGSRLHDNLGDPSANAAWSIISYILSGILFWGALGWLLDRWLFDGGADDSTTVVFLPIGVLLGAAAGGYLGYQRYLHQTQ